MPCSFTLPKAHSRGLSRTSRRRLLMMSARRDALSNLITKGYVRVSIGIGDNQCDGFEIIAISLAVSCSIVKKLYVLGQVCTPEVKEQHEQTNKIQHHLKSEFSYQSVP